jgi:hypothetical protein
MFGNIKIPSSKTYCYLGITFTLSGSQKITQDELRKKGLRAFFSLKSMLDLRHLSINSVFKLFDSLIVPVASYGCQTWIHNTSLFKLIAAGVLCKDEKNSLKRIAADPIERIHLKLLKWSLGLNKKATNLPCWGDSGRFPLVITQIKQAFGYYKRLEKLDCPDTPCLVGHAFAEQRQLILPWFNAWQKFTSNVNLTTASSPTTVRESTKAIFKELWFSACSVSSKLQLYTAVKKTIGYEPYLSIKVFKQRQAIAKLRCSNHKLNRETGRYGIIRSHTDRENATWNKCCKICCGDDAELLCHQPFSDPILEDEQHVLVSCPLYHHVRTRLDDETKSLVVAWEVESLEKLFCKPHIIHFSWFTSKIFRIRFPQQKNNIM